MIAALMSLMLSLTPQDPTIVWSAPKAEPTPIVVTPAPAPTIDLPDWARADPYAWERAQCSPLLRGDEDLQACQARVRVALECGERLALRVCDSGEALPADIAASVLRAPVSSRGGLGIGLYQAARQAEAAGYRLALESNRDGEVCFALLGPAAA